MRRIAAAIVAASRLSLWLGVIAFLVGCGQEASPDSRIPNTVERVGTPPKRQVLAFATKDAVWLLDGQRRRRLVSLPSGGELVNLLWSGDGRQVAFVIAATSYAVGRLTMVDIASGRTRSWPNVSGGGLAPSLAGVAVGGYESHFDEFLPDGRRVEHRANVAASKEALRYQDAARVTTSIALAVPVAGSWLVAAESSTRQGAKGSPHRLFFQEPVTGHLTLTAADRFTYSVGDVLRVSDRRVLWVAQSSGGACDTYNTIVDFGGRTPDLPDRGDGAWEIRRLAVGPGGIEAIARPLTGGFIEAVAECTPDDLTYQRLTLRQGRWVKTDEDVVDLAKATDGRVAQVRAASSGLRSDVGLPDLQYEGADVRALDGTVTRLPDDTRVVRYSPPTPTRLRQVRTGSRRISARDRLLDTGVGPLRLGDDPRALQQAVAEPLQFDIDDRGCGTMVLADKSVEDALGVRGHLVDNKLDWIEVTSRDTPVGYDEPLSDLQPDVSAIAPRGPVTSKGAQAGAEVDRLLGGHGQPSSTRQLGNDALEYVFAEGSATLIARVDGAGTVRHLEVRRDRHRGRCSVKAT